MAASTFLFDLIKTLSSSEKRYFRLYCNFQGGEKNYLKLFDLIAEQKDYDEQQIRKVFEGETFLKSLHVTKNYLYNLVLKSLRSFHAQSSIDQKLGDMITDMLILENRGLYLQARQSLNKAKKIATQYHRYYYLIFLLRKEATYHFAIDEKKMEENIERINSELEVANKILVEENLMFGFYHQSGFLTRSRTASQKGIQNLKEKFEEFRLAKPSNISRSFYSTYLEEFIHSAIAYERSDKKERYISTKKIIGFWKKNKHMIDAEPHVYKIHLANFLNAAFQVARYEDFPKTLEELQGMPSRNFNEEAETFQNLSFYQLLYYLNTKKLDTAVNTLSTITNGLNKYKTKINKAREFAFFYNISILYFMLDDIDRALLWINKIIHHSKTDRRKDIQRFAEMLQLFFHYNLKNFELLDSLLISTRKKLSRWKELSAFEKLCFESLKLLQSSFSKKEKKEVLLKFKNQLIELQKSEGVQIPIGYDEIMLWVEKELS